MSSGEIIFISPKGYGMANLDNGDKVFLPKRLLDQHSSEDIENKKIQIRCIDGFLGQVGTEIKLLPSAEKTPLQTEDSSG